MSQSIPPRWRRPLIWAVIALLAGAVIWLTDPARAEPPALLPQSQRADLVVIEKADRRLTLYRDGEVMQDFRIALGFAPEGDKNREGDGKTPEGTYRIDRRNDRSSFYLSLGIDYPRPDQRAAARAEGRNPGGDIFIHGQPNGYNGPALPYDWTAGCAAVSNAEIEQIWSRVAIGTKVEIRP
ncbi:MAG: L,D-transpeptidase family protein [Pseudomonadota bacterium]